MAKVGLLFVVKEKVLAKSVTLKDASIYGEYLTSYQGHDTVWENEYRYIYKKDYDYFPRGRVVYNKERKLFIIYVDKCILQRMLDKIVDEFELGAEQIVIDIDAHYVCNRCNSQYVDLQN